MTRKEIKEWAAETVAHIFHHHKMKYEEDSIHGWIAKDKNLKLHFFLEKPARHRDVWWVKSNPYKSGALIPPYGKLSLPVRDMFHYDFKWEDEPVEADIIFRIKKP